jgi:hypothetical protein
MPLISTRVAKNSHNSCGGMEYAASLSNPTSRVLHYGPVFDQAPEAPLPVL